MKALSLTQPWASLLALGCKTIETRDWSTDFRGWFLIHASKSFPKDAKDFAYKASVVNAMGDALKHLREQHIAPQWLEDWYKTTSENQPLGAIIGVVHLSHCEPTINVFDAASNQRVALRGSEVTVLGAMSNRMLNFRDVPKYEAHFGDYRVRGDRGRRRFAFWTTHAVPLLEPIECKGALNLWDTYDAALKHAVDTRATMTADDDTMIDSYEARIRAELARRGITLPMAGMYATLAQRGYSVRGFVDLVKSNVQSGDNQ